MKQNTYEYYKHELEKSQARMRELEEKGAEALSRYDIEIAAGGNAELALWTAKFLIGNHIKWFKRLLAETTPTPIQQSLF